MLDSRLREWDYGEQIGGPAKGHATERSLYVDRPYPGAESWRQAVARVVRFLDDLAMRWNGERVLVIGRVATRWAFDHCLNGIALKTLAAEHFEWQEGWEYRLATTARQDQWSVAQTGGWSS